MNLIVCLLGYTYVVYPPQDSWLNSHMVICVRPYQNSVVVSVVGGSNCKESCGTGHPKSVKVGWMASKHPFSATRDWELQSVSSFTVKQPATTGQNAKAQDEDPGSCHAKQIPYRKTLSLRDQDVHFHVSERITSDDT